MIKTAKLAVLLFCQPAGGSAVGDGRIKCPVREDGHAKQEAKVRDLVMHWQDWSPAEGNIPRSVLGAPPFKESLTDKEFPAVSNGTGGGAIHSLY
eukprot:9474634-Pyramimonas_sp.AAC.1